ncbi:MAG: signal peptide peptidase SppA [Bacteroidia bacterium]
MRQFLKYTLASMTGFLLAGILLLFIGIGIIASLASSGKKEVNVQQNSVLHLNFSELISDRPSNDPLAGIDFNSFEKTSSISGRDYVRLVTEAANDNNIKGIFLDLSNINVDATIRSSIRTALIDFKTSGKFIYAFSEGYLQNTYHLASVADSIFMVPTGDMLFNGWASSPLFFKGMLEKLDIDVKLIRVGKYKSAGEPFIRENLSDDNRHQISSFLNSLNQQYLSDLSRSLNMPVDTLQVIANELRIRSPKDAVAHGLIHRLCFRDEVLNLLASQTDVKKIDKIRFITASDYLRSLATERQLGEKNRIAVIYAIGDITGGEGDDETIGSDRLAAAIRKARLDDNVKAIVLRVNSPGGSALASDIIWRETVLAKAEKPLVVSMGNLAASGGYYIAAAADSIFASANTLTGSIGVFGLIPSFDRFMKNKIGITFDRVTTGPYADILNGLRPMTAEEEQIIQSMINRIYHDFLKVVADGRNLSTDSVNSLAQGRVYTGEQALALGLVDAMGDLNDAIACAARMAGLENYKLKELPERPDKFELLMSSLFETRQKAIANELGPFYQHYRTLKSVMQADRFLARMEFIPE